jgi:hypothetical protein
MEHAPVSAIGVPIAVSAPVEGFIEYVITLPESEPVVFVP